MHRIQLLALVVVLVLVACGDPGGDGGNEGEIITTVELAFTPAGGGAPIVAAFTDLDGDGGDPPVVDPVDLAAGTYTLAVRFANELEDPPEEITDEVRDESAEHQVFFTGTAVNGPATNNPGAPLAHAYADTDANGLPIGLASMIAATAGTGQLIVTLRHLPPLNGNAVKVVDLADQVKAGGFASIGGENDANVMFVVTVP